MNVQWRYSHTHAHAQENTHTPQSGLHGHVSSTSCKHYCVPCDRDHWNLIVWGNIRSALHGESDKQCCERWPGQTRSLLLCCDRCGTCLFFLIVLESSHPTTENDSTEQLQFSKHINVFNVFTLPAWKSDLALKWHRPEAPHSAGVNSRCQKEHVAILLTLKQTDLFLNVLYDIKKWIRVL